MQTICNKKSFQNLFRRYQEIVNEFKQKRFVSFFDIPQTGKLLDISCGEGDDLAAFYAQSPDLEYHGIDIKPNTIKQAQTKYPWAILREAEAQDLPYADTKFSVILSNMSLHHYKQPQRVFDEISRTLRKFGIFYLIDVMPKFRFRQWLFNQDRCDAPYHFEKYFTVLEASHLAKNAGLSKISEKSINWLESTRIIAFQKNN